jgi:hypothetical protein
MKIKTNTMLVKERKLESLSLDKMNETRFTIIDDVHCLQHMSQIEKKQQLYS